MDTDFKVGDAVVVHVPRPYIGRVYDMSERFLHVMTPFKISPRAAVLKIICEKVDSRLEPQRVKKL